MVTDYTTYLTSEFNPNASGSVSFGGLNIEDLDGANLLTNLQSLDLFDNRITSIESGDFAGLANLQWLDLSYNRVASIEPRAFEGLTNLQTLELRANRITSVDSRAFEGLTTLQTLELWPTPVARQTAKQAAGLRP